MRSVEEPGSRPKVPRIAAIRYRLAEGRLPFGAVMVVLVKNGFNPWR